MHKNNIKRDSSLSTKPNVIQETTLLSIPTVLFRDRSTPESTPPASPKASNPLLQFSASWSSTNSLSSICSSACGSRYTSDSYIFSPLKTKPVSIKVLTYRNKDYDYNSASLFDDPDDTYHFTRLTPDFFDRMLCLSENHGVFISFRLQDPYQISNRRYSLCTDDGIITSPKTTATVTTTNKFDTVCTGHIPRNPRFSQFKYDLSDNSYAGSFPKRVAQQATNTELLEYLHAFANKNIQDVKVYYNLICYSEIVPVYEKTTDNNQKSKFIRTNKTTLKHYIQEAERIDSVLDRIERGIYFFVAASENELIFRDSKNNICKFELSKLVNFEYAKITTTTSMSIKSFTKYVTAIGIECYHAALSYERNGIFLPIMVHAGANGFHISGDADPEHVGIRSDMPAIAYQTFNGKTDDPNKFLYGLDALLARLCINSIEKYEQHTGVKYNSAYYIDYTTIPYYRNIFIPLVENTLNTYASAPELLKTVGNSSLYHLIMQKEFDHPLYMHGTEDLHPGNKPGAFSAILICHKQQFVITSNEQSYLAFIFHDPSILRHQRIGVHPYWLCNDESEQSLSEYWLDLLEIQALHELDKDLEEFHTYCKILYANMRRITIFGDFAAHKIEQRFANITELNSVQIKDRISKLYAKHDLDIDEINSALNIKTFKNQLSI